MVEPWRVAQLVVDRGSGHDGLRGSGYLIAPGRVLTAAHVVAGASVVRVRLDVGQKTEIDVEAETRWADPVSCAGTDLAVVTISEDATAGRECQSARFGRISECPAVLTVQAFGFPRFKLRGDPADAERRGMFRDLEQVSGHTPVAANRRQGTLAVYLDDPGPGQPAAGEPSPWEGMSGSAVWAAGRIVAVVAEHHPSEGTGRLTARRIDRAYDRLPAPDLTGLVELLGLAPAASALPDVIPAERGQLVRSAYLAQARDLAPDSLIGRERELADWAEFCAGPDPYAWWQAGPWAGKTALAAWFVTHPPAGADVISFFITRRWGGEADSDAFLNAMIDQLNALNPVGGVSPAAGARAGAWLTLLELAAAQAEERERRLVVVVDGLDEDVAGATPSWGRASIASLLPRRPPRGVRFIVTSRPGPGLPEDLPDSHPLGTCKPRPLPVSQAAQHLELRARRELKRLFAGDQIAVCVVGYIAGAGGGLTMTDLSDLTEQPPYKLDDILRGVSGRSLETRPNTDPREAHRNSAQRVYLFAHETLRATAEERLGNELARYRQKVHEWVDAYASADWPDTTPGYAIRGYPRMLEATDDITRLSSLARSPSRHAFLLRATGSDDAALTEIRTAESLVVAQDAPELQDLIELAAYRHVFWIRSESIPINLGDLWARLGRFDHAVALARTIGGPDYQAQTLAGLVPMIAEAGNPDRAEALARAITDPNNQAEALARLAAVIAQAGDTDRAYRLAIDAEALYRTITDARVYPLSGVVPVLAQAGDPDRAEALARTITDPRARAYALAELVPVLAQAGDPDRAEALARTITDSSDQAEALTSLVPVIAQAGDTDRADRLATDAEALYRTTDPYSQHEALASLARVIAQAGDPDRAEALARTITDPFYQAKALTSLVPIIAQAGDPDRAETLARAITDPSDQAEALTSLVPVIAQAGDPDRASRLVTDAEALARSITGPYSQAQALAILASAVAQTGDSDRAEALARTITDPDSQAQALAGLASALAEAGDPERAYRLAIEAKDFYPTTDPESLSRTVFRLVNSLAEAGDFERAEALARTITDPLTLPYALSELATTLVEAGHPERAYRLATDAEALSRTFLYTHSQAEEFAGLVTALIRAGDPDRAYRLATDAVAHARTIAHPSFQAEELVRLVPVLAQAGDPDGAEALARAIAYPYRQAEALARLVPVIAQAGDTDRAYQLAAEAEAFARTITYPYGQAQALATLATALAQAGDPDRAYRLATDAQTVADADPNPLADELSALAEFVWLVPVIAQAGDPDRAEALARTITDPGARAHALTGLVPVIAQAGNPDRTSRLAADAEALARTITDPYDQAQALANLASVLAQAGDPGRAEALARSITDPDSQAQALAGLATVIVQAGDRDRAGLLLAHALIINTRGIWWVETVSHFFQWAIGSAWTILADAYRTGN